MPGSLGERLRDHWLAQGPPPRPGVCPEDLDAFEARHQVRFPPDFREYLSAVNGTGRDAEMDTSLHCWWSLEEFVSVAEEWPEEAICSAPETYFLFADHLIWAPVYAIRLDEKGAGSEVFAIWSDMNRFEMHPVAPSFSRLMERYFRDEILH